MCLLSIGFVIVLFILNLISISGAKPTKNQLAVNELDVMVVPVVAIGSGGMVSTVMVFELAELPETLVARTR